jgi:3-oxoacyl-(acyl-carrier-protein) synthase
VCEFPSNHGSSGSTSGGGGGIVTRPSMQAVLSNSFGFGGTNASLLFTRAPQ